ncbi:hypothetical protein MCACPph1_CDS0014 [Moorella phage MCACPph1]
MTFIVIRHGGRSCDRWREVFKGESEEKALAIYEREYEKMRQGGVILLGPQGEIKRRNWAPRIRTRW